MQNETSISPELMGKIVDEVFDGAIEDARVIEEIYAVIKHEEAALSAAEPVGGVQMHRTRHKISELAGWSHWSRWEEGFGKTDNPAFEIEIDNRIFYPAPPAPSVAVKAGEAAEKLQRALDAASPNHKTMWVYVDDLHSALSAQVQDVAGWQSIDTAPKDGTRILIWLVHPSARFSKDPVAEGWAAAHEAYWSDHNRGGWTWHGLCGAPTLWQHLPAPPAQQESKPLDLNITKEWLEKRAALEGDHEIGAGRRKLTASIDPTPEELAELHPLVHRIPEGWQLVPKEPTLEMMARGAESSCSLTEHGAHGVYRSMLAAAPGMQERD